MTSPTSIDAYLNELADQLTGPARRTRAFLLEVEAHLQDERDARVARGEDPAAAESAAIEQFGAPAEIARSENVGSWRAARGSVAEAMGGLVLQLGAVGMLVVGAAGGLTRLIASFGLLNAMYGLPRNVVMPASACAHWLAVQPSAATCTQAGTLEAADDLPQVSAAIGFVGLLAVGLFLLWSHQRPSARGVLPPTLGPAVAATMFGAATAGLVALGATNAVISTTWGQGMWLTDATCALVACIASVVLLLRAVRRGFASPPPAAPLPR